MKIEFSNSSLEEQKLYDASCKKILSYKPILAFILKHCISDFSTCSVEEITNNYIEQVEVSKVSIDPDRTNANNEATFVAQKIAGLNIEDSSITEGKIFYDIRFFAITPKKEPVKLIINIEAQTTERLSYSILTRGVYYACRLISSQKGVEFSGSHYEDMKKVYSIWICTNPHKEKGNSINRYYTIEEQVYGNVKEKRETYDLMEVIMIRLNYDVVPDNKLLEFLSTLFSPKLSSISKLKNMREELGTSGNHDLEIERAVTHMCNLSNDIRTMGREEGLLLGLEQGKLESIRQIVFNMLSKHVDDNFIIDIANISTEQLQQLKEEWLKAYPSNS